MNPLSELTSYLGAMKDALDITKGIIGLMPKGGDHERAERRLVDAEHALDASKAQLAKALRYHLCQCSFPPQLMLSEGYHSTHNVEVFRCGKCAKQNPSPHEISRLDKNKRYNDELGNRSDWVSSRF